jgi:hypothetical protein
MWQQGFAFKSDAGQTNNFANLVGMYAIFQQQRCQVYYSYRPGIANHFGFL